MQAKHLKPQFCLRRLFLGHNILPKDGHHNEISALMAFIFYCCENGLTPDLSHIILNQMIGSITTSGKGLPYGALLTRLFDHFHVPLPATDRTDLPSAIDDQTVGRSLPLKTQSQDDLFDDLMAEHTASGSGSSQNADYPSWAQEMLDLQRGMMTGQEDLVRQFGDFTVSSGTRFTNLDNRVERIEQQVGRIESQVGPIYNYHMSMRPPGSPYGPPPPYPPVPSPPQHPSGSQQHGYYPSYSPFYYPPPGQQ